MKPHRTLSAAALAVLASACVSVLPEPEVADGLYRLGPIETTETLSTTVSIREPDAPRTFSGRLMASEGADGALRYVRGPEWADSLTRMLQLAVLDSLDGVNGGAAIASDSGAPAKYELSWRVSDFVLSGGEARCRLELTLLSGRDRSPVAQDTLSRAVEVVGEGNTARALALRDVARACAAGTAAFVSDKAN